MKNTRFPCSLWFAEDLNKGQRVDPENMGQGYFLVTDNDMELKVLVLGLGDRAVELDASDDVSVHRPSATYACAHHLFCSLLSYRFHIDNDYFLDLIN
jgi:hypothetical protein